MVNFPLWLYTKKHYKVTDCAADLNISGRLKTLVCL